MAKQMSFKEIMPLELLRDDFIIMVMGATGSGKSNFIQQLLAGRPKVQGLKSVTSEIKAYRIFNPRVDSSISSLVIVDTPGFDDTSKTDYEILNMSAGWLRQSYSDGFPVAGLVYCHRMTDNRTSGSSHRNMRMFGKLTGSVTMQKVVLLQTMWDTVNPEVGNRRDQDLRTHFWKPMIDAKATVEKFHNSPTEAWEIVSRCVALHATQATGMDAVLLQEEMVTARKRVGETAAGKEIYNDYQRLLDRQRERLRELQSKQLTPETRKEVEKQIEDLDAQLNKTFEEIRQLKIPFLRKVILLFKGGSKAKPIDIPEDRTASPSRFA